MRMHEHVRGRNVRHGLVLVVASSARVLHDAVRGLDRVDLVCLAVPKPEHAEDHLESGTVQMLVLEWVPGSGDHGLKVIKKASEAGIPVVVVGAPNDVANELLRAGVLGLLPSPWVPGQLAALARRVATPVAEAAPELVLRVGPMTVEMGARRLLVDDVPINVTPTQFWLVAHLARAQGDVVSKEELYRRLWQHELDDGGQKLATHLRRLRSRLARYGADEVVVTVRGHGLALRAPAEAVAKGV